MKEVLSLIDRIEKNEWFIIVTFALKVLSACITFCSILKWTQDLFPNKK